MATAKLDNEGRITIPASVLADLGLSAGDHLEFIKIEHGRYELIAKTGSIRSLKGCIPKPQQPISIDEMNDVIAKQGSTTKNIY